MANHPEGGRGPSQPDDEGGPVKSFLEHLEDLRWVLVKSVVALGIAFVACLVGGDHVVSVLTYPLKRAKVHYEAGDQVVTVSLGSNRVGVFTLPPAQQPEVNLGTNRFVTLHLQAITIGTNQFVGFRPDSDSSEAERLSIPLVSLSPAGAFIVAVQVAIYAGVIIASPFLLYFIFQFVFPALKFTEKKYVYRGLLIGIGLFFTGVLFCYFALLPIALAASVRYTHWMGFSVPEWRAEDYISFVSKFMLGMGLGFEMPVVLLVLVKIGVLNYSLLSRSRRYVIIINFILGAVLTTPEVVTQVLMALPLQFLFEVSVWIAWYWEQPDRAKAQRRMVAVLLGIAIAAALVWLVIKSGQPWLHAHGY
jgi:sec-independent protein translocase protein TatC